VYKNKVYSNDEKKVDNKIKIMLFLFIKRKNEPQCIFRLKNLQ
jgi:hypothetical protein